eukprot:3067176-Rhodomonas_salina.1
MIASAGTLPSPPPAADDDNDAAALPCCRHRTQSERLLVLFWKTTETQMSAQERKSRRSYKSSRKLCEQKQKRRKNSKHPQHGLPFSLLILCNPRCVLSGLSASSFLPHQYSSQLAKLPATLCQAEWAERFCTGGAWLVTVGQKSHSSLRSTN